jgi:hypothetical protein
MNTDISIYIDFINCFIEGLLEDYLEGYLDSNLI